MKEDEVIYIKEWLTRYNMTEESIYKLVLDSYLNNRPVKLGQPMYAPVAYGKDGIILKERDDACRLEAGTEGCSIKSDGIVEAHWTIGPLTEHAHFEYSKRYLYEYHPGKLYLMRLSVDDYLGVYIRWALGF